MMAVCDDGMAVYKLILALYIRMTCIIMMQDILLAFFIHNFNNPVSREKRGMHGFVENLPCPLVKMKVGYITKSLAIILSINKFVNRTMP